MVVSLTAVTICMLVLLPTTSSSPRFLFFFPFSSFWSLVWCMCAWIQLMASIFLYFFSSSSFCLLCDHVFLLLSPFPFFVDLTNAFAGCNISSPLRHSTKNISFLFPLRLASSWLRGMQWDGVALVTWTRESEIAKADLQIKPLCSDSPFPSPSSLSCCSM